ncbi:MAG: hypothetical protein ACYC3L_02625 [Gemmatimonadaceae bacterium]
MPDERGAPPPASRTTAATTPPPWTRADVVVLAAVLGIAAVLTWPELFHGWYSWDDGAMAQVAERVMRGELPHRDFDEPWTGGWSFVQAGLFHLFGTSLRMLRVPIFIAWLASLACGFRLARRFVSPAVGGVVTLAWGAWSLYAWHYPLLNWYYAPLALCSAWGVTRFVESRRRWYVVFAGAMAGIAFAQKITGLFLLAALLLWCAAHVAFAAPPVRREASRARGFALLVTAAGGVFVALVARLVWGLPAEFHGSAAFVFIVPIVVTVLWMGWSAWESGVAVAAGLRALLSLLLPLLAGVAVPLVPMLLVYAAHGAVHDLVFGVFVRPAARLALLWFAPPGRLAMGGMMLAPLVLALGVRYAAPPRARPAIAAALVLGAVAGALSHYDQFTASSTALMMRGIPVLLPFVALWGAWRREDEPGPYRSVAFLLVACAATSQLLQVPYAFLPYALYATPIALVALVAVVAQRTATPAPALLLAGAFFLVAGVGHPATSEAKPEPERWAKLTMPRGGLWVSPQDSAQFAGVAQLLAARPAGPVLVVGDAPEYAFLLERPSASRVIYDVLADSASKDAQLVLPRLARAGVQTVILLNQFGMNDSLTTRQERALRQEFPHSRGFGRVVLDGRTFRRFVEVRWRGDSLR